MSSTAYDEVLDFITSAPSLEQIVNFQHSPKTVERVNYLLQCVDDETITDTEREELREFSRADELMEQLKIRAKRRLGIENEPH